MSSASPHVYQSTNHHRRDVSESTIYEDNPRSSPFPSPSKLYSNNNKIEWIGSSSKGSSLGTKGQPDVQFKKGKSNTSWPDSRVLLLRTLSWYKSFQGQGNPQDAWDEFFGDIYNYGRNTVYRVRKWIFLVGKEKLQNHVRDTLSLTLISARKMYYKEWMETANSVGQGKKEPKRKREGQGVEVDETKRRKVDHGKALSDVRPGEDSDIEIVGN